jgi:hypothetical protein
MAYADYLPHLAYSVKESRFQHVLKFGTHVLGALGVLWRN